MSASDPDKKQWPDPKDYGLPFVEIVPLRRETADGDLPASAAKAEKPTEAILPAASIGEGEVSMPVRETPSVASQQAATSVSNKQVEGSKSSSWVWVVALVGLGIVAVIVWQILANKNTEGQKPVFEVVDEPVTQAPAATTDSPAETTPTDQNQPALNQDPISSENISNPNISKPAETGTTIANTASGNLIRVESKAERPQYFIIVGSLPNERLAMEEARQYFGRSAEIYLIAPYEGGKNYRLALSKFGSFKAAAEKLEEIKSQYTEELWILKY